VEQQAASRDNASLYTVAKYDPQSDPAKDLAETIRIASEANKRILLQVGGEWCGWCHKFDAYIADHAAVLQAIRENFVIMKVSYSDDNQNEAFLAKYPSIPGYPHLYVLESDGTLLHSQNTVELEEGSSYNQAALLAFVDRWKAN
jgi:thiol:disulfide interchange protein